ncbi:hypothetical protein [Fibrobacter sp.]|jgi:hypothetical protein|nr:hypothetical protein [Fibrobacter sp.]MBR3070693.1 hypothetical protein [Fibrobacter sp.]
MKNELENTFLLYHDKDGKTDISVDIELPKAATIKKFFIVQQDGRT